MGHFFNHWTWRRLGEPSCYTISPEEGWGNPAKRRGKTKCQLVCRAGNTCEQVMSFAQRLKSMATPVKSASIVRQPNRSSLKANLSRLELSNRKKTDKESSWSKLYLSILFISFISHSFSSSLSQRVPSETLAEAQSGVQHCCGWQEMNWLVEKPVAWTCCGIYPPRRQYEDMRVGSTEDDEKSGGELFRDWLGLIRWPFA